MHVPRGQASVIKGEGVGSGRLAARGGVTTSEKMGELRSA
jgi:hypothetical protein